MNDSYLQGLKEARVRLPDASGALLGPNARAAYKAAQALLDELIAETELPYQVVIRRYDTGALACHYGHYATLAEAEEACGWIGSERAGAQVEERLPDNSWRELSCSGGSAARRA